MENSVKTVSQIIRLMLEAHPEYHDAILSLIEQKRVEQRTRREYFGLNNIDKILSSHLNYSGGYFVELGANDGVNQSNTLHFEIHKGWRGVLVEPVPHNFLKCLFNRSNENKVFCNACVSFGFNQDFVEMIYSNLMSVSKGLDTDIDDPYGHAALGKQFLPASERIFEFGAKARTLNSILEEADSPAQIDLLSLDVEGAEIEVLRGVNHNKYRFKLICVETRDEIKICNQLNEWGYVFTEKISDRDLIFKPVDQ